MVTIIFEPHATSYDNEEGIASGHHDVALAPSGEREAADLGKRYENERFDTVFCSDLQRSYRTAEIAFADRNFLIVKDPRLRECDYGEWTRRPNAEIKPERAQRITAPFPGGESLEEVSERVKRFLQDLLGHYDGKKVMVIGHRATHDSLEHWIKGMPLASAVTAPREWQPGWTYELRGLSSSVHFPE